jgi:hypothetical protein
MESNLDNEFVLETCPICLEDIELCAYNYIKTECKHCFHASCFLTNTRRNGYSCPCCRKELIENLDSTTDSESDLDLEPDYNPAHDLSLLAFRYLMARVEGESTDYDDEAIEDTSSIWTMEDDMYQRGHIMHGQGGAPNLSIEQVANKLRLMDLNYEDLVALYVLPHKDNTNDLAMYDTQWISNNERAIRNILLGR